MSVDKFSGEPSPDRAPVLNEFGHRVKPVMDISEYAVKMDERDLTLDGSGLLPDPTPMEPPLGFIRQPTMVEHMRAMILSERLRMEALQAGAETFEEADDFNVDDDPEPMSAYEMEENFEPPIIRAAEPAEPASSPATVGPGPTPSEPASPAPSPAP